MPPMTTGNSHGITGTPSMAILNPPWNPFKEVWKSFKAREELWRTYSHPPPCSGGWVLRSLMRWRSLRSSGVRLHGEEGGNINTQKQRDRDGWKSLLHHVLRDAAGAAERPWGFRVIKWSDRTFIKKQTQGLKIPLVASRGRAVPNRTEVFEWTGCALNPSVLVSGSQKMWK